MVNNFDCLRDYLFNCLDDLENKNSTVLAVCSISAMVLNYFAIRVMETFFAQIIVGALNLQ